MFSNSSNIDDIILSADFFLGMEVFLDGAVALALLVVDPPKFPKPPDTGSFLLLAAAADLVELVSFKKSEMFRGDKKRSN